MKKLLFILALIVSVFVANAQTLTTPTAGDFDSYISQASYYYVTDSLNDTDTTLYTFRVKGPTVQNFTVKLYLDWVSGTAGGVLTVLRSIDGVNYQAYSDTTITASAVTADIMDTETIDLDDYGYPYLRLQYIQSGTAITRPNIYIYNKGN
jgi:hypothetical protein